MQDTDNQRPWHLQSAENLTEYFNNQDQPLTFKWANDADGKRCLEAWVDDSFYEIGDVEVQDSLLDVDPQPILAARFYPDGDPQYGDYRTLIYARRSFAIDGYLFYLAIEKLLLHDPDSARSMALAHMDAVWMVKRDVIMTKFGIESKGDDFYQLSSTWKPAEAA